MGRKIIEALILIGAILLGAVILMASFVFMSCTHVPAEGDVRGCYVRILPRYGKPTAFYEPFLKTGESLSESGSPEIWGYKVWDEPYRKGDLALAINIPEERFVEKGRIKIISGVPCRCPDWSGW